VSSSEEKLKSIVGHEAFSARKNSGPLIYSTLIRFFCLVCCV